MSHGTPRHSCPSPGSNEFGRHSTPSLPVRVLLRTIVIGFLGIVVSGIGHTVLQPVRNESDEVALFVVSLIEERATLDNVPSGFEQDLGYRPISRAGSLVSPRGGCSTPVGSAPETFDTACRIHDLGYDILRDAASSEIRLGPWARYHLDLRLYNDLLRTCERLTCRTTAAAYYAAVSANSIRQGYGAPTAEPTTPWIGFALAVVVVSVATTPEALGRIVRGRGKGRLARALQRKFVGQPGLVGYSSAVVAPGPDSPTLSGLSQPVSYTYRVSSLRLVTWTFRKMLEM